MAAPLKIVRVVLLMRHGVRPPTHEPALNPSIAPDAWPSWDVPNGYLTPHGAAAISLLAAYDRRQLAPGAGCPRITIYTDVDERTVKTGEAYAAGFAPGCKIAVEHSPARKDPLFAPLEHNASGFSTKAAETMLVAAGGALTSPVRANQALFQKMQDVLDPGASGFLKLPAKLSAKTPGGLPKLTGPIAEGSSASEDFLLEYLEGKPLSEVAWGRAGRDQVAALLALHPLGYSITARPDYIARATAAPLARRILSSLSTGAPIQVLVGHDTNIAELGGLLDLHWSLGGYPPDDPPPGGGLMFSLLVGAGGTKYVTIVYQVQTMDQIRDLTPLDISNPPATVALPIPGCGNSPEQTACSLSAFAKLIALKTPAG